MGIGTVINDSNTGLSVVDYKSYTKMKNTSGASVAIGDIVAFKAVAAGDEVTTTTTQGDDLVHGMAIETITDTRRKKRRNTICVCYNRKYWLYANH